MANVKTINGLLRANCKSRNGVLSANIKTINGVDAVVSGGSPFGGLVSTTDLVEWWPLDEASGTRVGVHAGLDLTDNNTVTGVAGGGPDGSDVSLFTRANDEFLSRASEAALQTGDIDFSMSVWFYLVSKPSSATLFSRYSVDASAFEYSCEYNSGADRLRWFANGAAGVQTIVVANNGGALSLNTWYHMVAWHDSVGNTVNVAVNAGTADSAAHSAGMNSTAAPFRLGNWLHSGSNVRQFDGRMQRVGMWKRILTSGERTALYNSGNGLDY